jgi:hypothetical protein
MAPPHTVDEIQKLKKWRADATILNEQQRVTDSNWPSILGVGQVLATPQCKKRMASYEMLGRVSGLDGFIENVK